MLVPFLSCPSLQLHAQPIRSDPMLRCLSFQLSSFRRHYCRSTPCTSSPVPSGTFLPLQANPIGWRNLPIVSILLRTYAHRFYSITAFTIHAFTIASSLLPAVTAFPILCALCRSTQVHYCRSKRVRAVPVLAYPLLPLQRRSSPNDTVPIPYCLSIHDPIRAHPLRAVPLHLSTRLYASTANQLHSAPCCSDPLH